MSDTFQKEIIDIASSYIPSDLEMDRRGAYLAYRLAEEQLLNGTARAQVMVHYLRKGSAREQIEIEMMRAKIALLEGQLEQCRNEVNILDMVRDAMDALREYRGEPSDENVY